MFLDTFKAARNAFGRLFRWCFERLWGGSGRARESFLEPWGGFGELMGGLLAPSGRQDCPRRPPSGVKRPQEAATKLLRAGFWSPNGPKRIQRASKRGIMQMMLKTSKLMTFSMKMLDFKAWKG